MISTKALLQGTMVLTVGHVAGYGLSFTRNIILARVLAKADFGLAAAFAMTVLLLDVAGRMSFGQQIVQSKDGDSVSFQATSHTFQFLLAVAAALLISGLSHPLAVAFNVPQLTWAFMLLSVVPLARGLEHLDYYRRQRELKYLPTVLCEVAPQVFVTLAAWPLAVWLGDFRVIIWLMIGKAGFGLLMTHLLATRPYHWALQRNYVKGMWVFGWPLLLNGLLMFASQQADQVVVGSFLSLEDLAVYALALSLVSIPWFLVAQVGSSLVLPILSRMQDDSNAFRHQYRSCVEYASVAGVLLILPLIVGGEQLVVLVFGSKYAGTGILMAVLGATCAVRFLRFVPAAAAMARADTMNQLYSNLWRGLGLPLALTAAALGCGVAWIAACALVAELMATVFSTLRLQKRQGVPWRHTAGAAIYVVGFVLAGWALVCIGAPNWSCWLVAGSVIAVLTTAVVVAFIVFPGFARIAVDATGRKCLPGFQKPGRSGLL